MVDLSFLKDKKYIKLSAIIGVILILDIVFILRTQIVFLAKIIPQVHKLQKEISVAKKDIAAKTGLMDRLEKVKIDGLKAQRKIISERDISLFFGVLSRIAKENEIKISQIKPGQLKSAKEEPKSKTKTKKPAEPYNRLTLDLELKGTYHATGNFINKLEANERYIRIINLDMASVDEAPFEYPVKMSVEIFVAKTK